jgi:hypothetical protein
MQSKDLRLLLQLQLLLHLYLPFFVLLFVIPQGSPIVVAVVVIWLLPSLLGPKASASGLSSQQQIGALALGYGSFCQSHKGKA